MNVMRRRPVTHPPWAHLSTLPVRSAMGRPSRLIVLPTAENDWGTAVAATASSGTGPQLRGMWNNWLKGKGLAL
jgi:hypothetical protein